METIVRLQVYIVSFLILLTIYIRLKEEAQIYSLQDQLFKYLTLLTMIPLISEAISWCANGNPGQIIRILNMGSNTLLLVTNLIPLVIWTFYIMSTISDDKKFLIKGFTPMGILVTINVLIASSTPFSKKYFYIDANNFYYRGEWAIVAISIYVLLFAYNLFIILYNWEKINQRNRTSMLLFLVPPIAGFLLQMMFYGTSLVWPGSAISILMVYLQIQSQRIKRDYLTGLYNRRELDFYLERKIRDLPTGKKFAGIMIDVDDFKIINDQYGHAVGDIAIKTTAAIITRAFHKDEFVARYGGDEFIVLIDLKNEQELHHRVTNLKKQFVLFNGKNEEIFTLQISVGADIYSSGDGCGAEFLNRLDQLMYIQKRNKKQKLKTKTS